MIGIFRSSETMSRRRISDELKERLIEAFNEGEDYEELARQLNIKRSTIIRSEQPPRRTMWGGFCHRRLDAEMIEEATDIIEEYPAYSLEQILAELRLRLPNKSTLGRSTLSSALNGRLICLKKLENCPAERNSDQTKNLHRECAEWFLNDGVNRQELIYIDETGGNLYLSRTRGRARQGEGPADPAPHGRARSSPPNLHGHQSIPFLPPTAMF